jgi:hypothetical protein
VSQFVSSDAYTFPAWNTASDICDIHHLNLNTSPCPDPSEKGQVVDFVRLANLRQDPKPPPQHRLFNITYNKKIGF